jgi:hypothetical protein
VNDREIFWRNASLGEDLACILALEDHMVSHAGYLELYAIDPAMILPAIERSDPIQAVDDGLSTAWNRLPGCQR